MTDGTGDPDEPGFIALFGSRSRAWTQRDQAIGVRIRERIFGTLVGERRGRWVLLEKIGEGAMGIVYAAYDSRLQRRVALKLVRPSIASPREERRLLAEARAMARLSHPNVAAVYEVDFTHGELRVVMEFVEGTDIRSWIEAKRPGWRKVVTIFARAARGLAAAHDVGIIHRDVKPSNIVVGPDGRPRVVDFGLASDCSGHLAAAMIGTPRYMAPEQHVGGALTAASDQYAFCVGLLEALTGTTPFPGETPRELVKAKLAADFARLRPRRMDRILRRGLAPDPRQRFASMHALAESLDEAAAPRRTWWIPAVIGTAATALFAWGRPQPCVTPLPTNPLADPVTAAALTAALTRDGHPLGEVTRDLAFATVSRYSTALSTTHAEACRAATDVDGSASRCVEHLDYELEATVTALTHDDAAVLHAMPALSDLRPPISCDASAAEVAHDQPGRPVIDARVLRRMGQLDDAAAVLDHVLRSPDGPGDAAWARIELAQVEFMRAEYAAATALLSRAAALSVAGDFHAASAEAWTALLRVRAESGSDTRESALIEEIARAAVSRAGNLPHARARLEAGLGDMAFSRGDAPDARRHYAAAVEIAEALPPDAGVLQATLLRKLGSAALVAGDAEAGRAATMQARDLADEAFGPDHPEVLAIRNNIAVTTGLLGDYPEAIAATTSLAARLAAIVGTEHPDYGRALGNIGTVHAMAAHHDEAIDAFRRARIVLQSSLGPGHLDSIRTMANIGIALLEVGRRDEAVGELSRAAERLEEARATLSDLGPRVYTSLGLARVRLGQVEQGTHDLRRAVALADRRGGDFRARSRLQLATALEGDEAETMRASAASICEEGWRECAR